MSDMYPDLVHMELDGSVPYDFSMSQNSKLEMSMAQGKGSLNRIDCIFVGYLPGAKGNIGGSKHHCAAYSFLGMFNKKAYEIL